MYDFDWTVVQEWGSDVVKGKVKEEEPPDFMVTEIALGHDNKYLGGARAHSWTHQSLAANVPHGGHCENY